MRDMRRDVIFILSVLVSLCCAAQEFRFDHGPYLQNVDCNGVTIFFTTSRPAFSWIEVEGKEWKSSQQFYTVEDGLIEAYNQKNAIEIEGLKPGCHYRYRMVSKEMKEFRPYRITYGDSITSDWESFTTLPEKMESCSFTIINDGHDDAEKVRTLLEHSNVKEADAVFYLGDMISHFEHPDIPYKGFIDISTELFAKQKPFIAVRGNHETRGNLARHYSDYAGCPNGRFYNIYYFGNTAVIVLDTGEDKPDTHPVYGGINRFDEYRREQAEWLKREIKSKKFRKTKNRIVLMHIPPVFTSRSATPEDHAVAELANLFIPIFNDAKIDLVISGHTHRHHFIEEKRELNRFPIVINDHRSVMNLRIDKEGIGIVISDLKGNETFNKEFKR